MTPSFHVLIVENSREKVAEIERTLTKRWPALTCAQVDSAEAMQAAWKKHSWDCVLSGTQVPGFSPVEVLETIKQGPPGVPLIFIAKTDRREEAIELIRAGAHDVVCKDEFEQLAPAIARAIEKIASLKQRLVLPSRERESDIGGLENRERRFSQAFHSHSTAMQILKLDTGERLEINKKCLEIYGVNSLEELNDSIFSDNRWVESSKQSESVQRLIEEGVLHNYPIEIYSPDKQVIHLECNAAVIDRDHGNIAILSYLDVTKQKQIEAALVESELLLRESQKMAGLGTYVLDIQKGMWRSSKTLDNIFGISHDTERTVDLWESLVHTDHRQQMSDYFKNNVISDLEPFDRTYKIVRKNDGAERWVHGLGKLELNDKGEPVRMIGTIQDITEPRLAEMALKASEAQWRTLLNSLPNLVWLKDTQGRYLACNNRFEQYYGLQESEIIGKSDYDLTDQVSAESYTREDQQTMESGQPSIHDESVYFSDSGESKQLEKIKVPMFKPDGSLLGVLGVGHDVTERKQQEELVSLQAQRAEALRRLSNFTEPMEEEKFVMFGLELAENLTGSRISFAHLPQRDSLSAEVITCSERTLVQGFGAEDNEHVPVEKVKAWSNAFPTGTPVIVNDYTSYQQDHDLPESPVELSRMLNVTVLDNEDIVLLMRVGNKTQDYSEEDLETVRLVSEEIWYVLLRRRLEARNFLLSRVIKQSLSEIYIFDAKTLKFIDVNRTAQRNTEYSAEELHGMTPLDLNPQIGPESYSALLEILSSGQRKELEFETVHRRKDQTMYPVEIHLQYMQEDPPVFVSIARDIDERLRMESELRKLALVVEQSPESIVITDLHADIEYVNQAFVDATGYSREEVLGRNPRILHSGETPRETFRSMWQSLTSGQSWQGELYNMDKSGKKYVENVLITPIRDEHDEVTHYVAIKQDITEKKQLIEELDAHRDHLQELVNERTSELAIAREKAESANRAKSLFLANMSHEIRTPLNAIIGLTHLLQREQPTLDPQSRLSKIEASATHLLSIINDVLDISKIEAGKLQLDHSNFQVNELFEDVQTFFRERIDAKGLIVEIEENESPDWLNGDSTRIRQALFNYVDNAIKFTEHGTILLRAKKLAEMSDSVLMRFEVQDPGLGIDNESLSNIFKTFEQADPSSTRKFGGSGLGLAITKRLAALMEGEVGVESEPGKGSLFWFTARLNHASGIRASERPARKANAEQILQNHFAGSRILLAEDNAINREVAVALLTAAGLIVDTAENGLQAVAMAKDVDYDLVLMDVQMPEMDGLSAARLIRSSDHSPTRNANTPILALTANVFEEDRRVCLDAGMVDFIPKPVEPVALFSTIIKWLEESTGITEESHSTQLTEAEEDQDMNTDEEHDKTVGDAVQMDPEALVGIFGHDTAMHQSILQKFILQTEDILAEIAKACAEDDAKNVAFHAHKLKSSARTVGAIQLADLCVELEAMGKNADWAGINKLVEGLRPAADGVKDYVAASWPGE